MDITAVAPYIGSPSTAFSATSSTLMIEASVSDSAEREGVGALEPSAATGGTGDSERKRLLVIVRRGKVRNTIEAMKGTFPIRREYSEAKSGPAAKS